MDLGLEGKVAIVTGAGSQVGFGKAISLTLAEEGCDIVAVDIDFDGAVRTAAEIESLGRMALAIKADVTRKTDLEEMVKKTMEKFGKIDILVNNAGALLGEGPFLEQEEDLWDRQLALNLKSCMLCSQAVLPVMIANKYGRIVNIASDTAKLVWPLVSGYHIAKAGVYKFTRDLARTFVSHGILVNCISPGWSMDTDFMKGDKEAAEKSFLAETPLGRGTTPQDIAHATAFFVSDVSSDIVGQILSISGGSSMQ